MIIRKQKGFPEKDLKRENKKQRWEVSLINSVVNVLEITTALFFIFMLTRERGSKEFR